jgi:hypothetical protein
VKNPNRISNLVIQRGRGGGKKGNGMANESKNQFSSLLAMLFLCRILEVRIRD